MAVSITICNLALGELRAAPIVDIAENSPEAAACATYYPHCLSVLLDLHEWSFANRRATLALLSDNDRPNEWAYAYAVPAGVGSPLRVLSSCDNGGPVSLPWLPHNFRAPDNWWSTYIIESGKLYCQIPDAILEYSAADIDEAAMTPAFTDALVYALASRLAVPLRDDSKRKGELLQQAEVATQRAIADDRNRQPQREVEGVDEVALVRGGARC